MITAAVLGASGYSGAELLRLLHGRRDISITRCIAASSAGKPVADVYPAFAGRIDSSYESLEISGLEGTDVTFLALPSGEAMHIVPQLIGKTSRIIDLGGDFRLPSAGLYKEYYHREHAAASLLADAVYGLPEINLAKIRDAQLVANPGCYPTSAILALLPALTHNIIASDGITITSMSGVSGAGRSASVEMSFSEVNENIRAYKIGQHQHLPEIESVLSGATRKQVVVSFVPHLVPMTRGIYTTVHGTLLAPVSEVDVYKLYAEFYHDAPFVRLKNEVPQITHVLRTNYCDVYVKVDARTHQLIMISVIDNLVKGAAGQAVQNMNIMFHLPQHEGL